MKGVPAAARSAAVEDAAGGAEDVGGATGDGGVAASAGRGVPAAGSPASRRTTKGFPHRGHRTLAPRSGIRWSSMPYAARQCGQSTLIACPSRAASAASRPVEFLEVAGR